MEGGEHHARHLDAIVPTQDIPVQVQLQGVLSTVAVWQVLQRRPVELYTCIHVESYNKATSNSVVQLLTTIIVQVQSSYKHKTNKTQYSAIKYLYTVY